MEAMRNTWTDERLDDGFDRVTADIGSLREEVGSLRQELRQEVGSLRQELRQEVGGLRQELHQEIGGLRKELRLEVGGLREEMGDLQRTLLLLGGGVIAALLGIIATQL